MEKIGIETTTSEMDNMNAIKNNIENYIFTHRNHSDNEIEGGWSPDSFEVGGRRIVFMGVMHTPETLLHFWNEINDSIDNADIVVLEAAPEASGMLENEVLLDTIQKHYKENGHSLTKEQIIEYLKDDPSVRFYHFIEMICAVKGKHIVVVDPESQGAKLFDLKKIGEVADIMKAIIGIGGTAGFLASVAQDLIKKIRDSKEGKEGKTRRGFIKDLAELAGFIGITLSYSNYASLLESSEDKPIAGALDARKRGRVNNPIGALLYDVDDFRDVCISKGISKLVDDERQIGKNIAVIYGTAHESAVEYYSKVSTERDARFAMYAPYREETDPKVIEYRYNRDRREWEIIHAEKL